MSVWSAKQHEIWHRSYSNTVKMQFWYNQQHQLQAVPLIKTKSVYFSGFIAREAKEQPHASCHVQWEMSPWGEWIKVVMCTQKVKQDVVKKKICFTFYTIFYQHWRFFRYLQDVGYHTNAPEEEEKEETFSTCNNLSKNSILPAVYRIKRGFYLTADAVQKCRQRV